MPSIVTNAKGQTFTSSFEAKSHPYQVEHKLHLLQRGLAPLITILTGGKAGIKGQKNSTFYHHEVELIPPTGTCTAAGAAACATLTMANDYVNFQNFDLAMNERTKSVIQFNDTSITGSGDSIVYVGGTDLGSAVGDVYRRLSSAFSEGGTSPNPAMTVEVIKTHHLQKVRKTVEVTKEGELTDDIHGSKIAREIVKKTEQVKIEQEMAAYFGVGSSDTGANPTSSNYTCTTSAGIYHTLTSNVNKSVGALTLGGLREYFDLARRYHPEGEWLVVTSGAILGALNDILGDKMVIQNGAKKYGLNILDINLGSNHLHFVEQPMFTGELAKIAIGIPEPVTDYLRLCNLAGFPLSWYKDIKKDDGNDTRKDEIKGWFGTQMIEEPRWVLLDGITG